MAFNLSTFPNARNHANFGLYGLMQEARVWVRSFRAFGAFRVLGHLGQVGNLGHLRFGLRDEAETQTCRRPASPCFLPPDPPTIRD